MKPYPPQLKLRAEQLRREGYSLNQIGHKLGVARNTVFRWLNPVAAEKSRIASRDRKRAIKGICENCGAVTKCCRPGGSLPSRLCRSCARGKKWTRARIIEAIQEWERRRGKPPVSTEWKSRQCDPDGFEYPPSSSVYSRGKPFVSWAEAIEAAGFPRPEIGHKRNQLPGLPKGKPTTAAERREYRIAALRRALAKENRDGDRHRERNHHD